MKLLHCFGALTVAAVLSCGANAAVYSVSGSMVGVEVATDFFPPDSYHVSFNPEHPAFTGTWNIDLTNPALSGTANFESYWAYTAIDGFGTTTLQRPNDQHTISTAGALVSYNPASYTLTITQAFLNIGGTSENCTSTGWLVCDPPGTVYEYDSELTLLLVFDPTLQSFTGTSVNVRTFASGAIDRAAWQFSGTEVPLPAAAWLFGSCLAGVVGMGASRRGRVQP